METDRSAGEQFQPSADALSAAQAANLRAMLENSLQRTPLAATNATATPPVSGTLPNGSRAGSMGNSGGISKEDALQVRRMLLNTLASPGAGDVSSNGGDSNKRNSDVSPHRGKVD